MSSQLSALPPNVLLSVESLRELSSATTISDDAWDDVASYAKVVADSLKTDTLRSTLGDHDITSSISKLLLVSAGSDAAYLRGIDGEAKVAGTTELFRVLGNLCFDHDANRELVLAAGIPKLVVDVLALELGLIMEQDERRSEEAAKPFSRMDLLLFRAGAGALLNMSNQCDPIKHDLREPKALTLFAALLDAREDSSLRRRGALYKPNAWAGAPPPEREEEWQEDVLMGAMIIGWVSNILDDVMEEDKSHYPAYCIPALCSIPLTSQLLPATLPSSSTFPPDDLATLLDTDLDLLTSSTTLLERLSTSLDSVKEALAFALYAPSSGFSVSGDTLLSHLFSFIEAGAPPLCWTLYPTESESTSEERDKLFSSAKAAVMRSVVEAPNSDVVMQAFFDSVGRHWVIEELVRWIEEPQQGREDMLVCATHMLAAFARKDEHCLTLVGTYGIAEPLTSVLATKVKEHLSLTGKPGEVTQILYGVVSFLRHLAIPAANKPILGDLGVGGLVTPLLGSGLDVVAQLQSATIGLLKQLTVSNGPNCLQFVGLSPGFDATSPTALAAVLAIISRTDDLRLRSEATRTLINVVKSLFASSATPIEKNARKNIGHKDVVDALGELVRTSGKFPMLVNEGVVGLTLLAGNGRAGALLVLDALLESHPIPPTPTAEADTDAPVEAAPPSITLDQLLLWLDLAASQTLSEETVRPEMVSNVCALLLSVRNGVADNDEGVEDLRAAVQPVLEKMVAVVDGGLKSLAGAVLAALQQ